MILAHECRSWRYDDVASMRDAFSVVESRIFSKNDPANFSLFSIIDSMLGESRLYALGFHVDADVLGDVVGLPLPPRPDAARGLLAQRLRNYFDALKAGRVAPGEQWADVRHHDADRLYLGDPQDMIEVRRTDDPLVALVGVREEVV